MYETNQTLKTAEQLIRDRFPGYFGENRRIDHMVSSYFERKGREINYITVYLTPDSPPLDQRVISEFNINLKEELTGRGLRDWPAIAFVTTDHPAP